MQWEGVKTERYESPAVTMIEIMVETCIATSTEEIRQGEEQDWL